MDLLWIKLPDGQAMTGTFRQATRRELPGGNLRAGFPGNHQSNCEQIINHRTLKDNEIHIPYHNHPVSRHGRCIGQGSPSNLPDDISGTTQSLSLPSTRNYIVTHTYLKPFADPGQSTKTGDSAPVVEYFDGLGRPIQRVAVKASQSGGDMVDRQDYDLAGNPEKQWLAYARASNNGAYVAPTTFESGQNTFLSGIYGTTDGSKGYAVTVYEKSPLNRVEKQGAPGAAWQTGTNDKPVKYAYRASTTADNVQTWKYTGDNYSSYTYPAGSLFVTETIDEDAKTVSEFKDKQGRLVMHLMGSSRTRYCYDEFGRLRCVVQPTATSPASTDNTFLYKHNKKGLITDKKLPLGDWSVYVYDSRNRLVLSQDGNQRAKSPGEWSYTIYDYQNREIQF
jgi:YD repeat-containing protein